VCDLNVRQQCVEQTDERKQFLLAAQVVATENNSYKLILRWLDAALFGQVAALM
jgi:hypothetical protein